jgi:LuxR family transcriptional regulator
VDSWRDDCLQRLSRASGSIEMLVDELSTVVAELGFEYCSYVLKHAVPAAGEDAVAWASTYPSAWLERYFSQDYLRIDPLVRDSTKSFGPLVWSAAAREDAPEFWEEADSFGVRHGWALTTFGRGGVSSVLSLARSSTALSAADLDRHEAKLVWLAQVSLGFLSAASAGSRPEPSPEELTAREREVLRWTAMGKTAGEIAMILGITTRTANFHIMRCITKLDVANKTQAVAKALLFDMLY